MGHRRPNPPRLSPRIPLPLSGTSPKRGRTTSARSKVNDSLKKFSEAAARLVRSLGTISLDERLSLIARELCSTLNAETAGIFFVDPSDEKHLRLKAGYGQKQGFEPGTLPPVPIVPDRGLTGFIAHTGRLF